MAFTGITRMLGQILLDTGIIGQETLEAALGRTKRTKERLGEALIAMRAVSKDDVLRSVAIQMGMPYLAPDEIPSALPVIKNLSPKYLRQYTCVPVALDGPAVTVATSDPGNPVMLDDLRQILQGLTVKLCISPPEAILEAIERTYGAGASSALQKIVEGMGTEGSGDSEEDLAHLRDMAFDAPVVRLANLIIESAVTAEASDIHIEPFEDTLRVRYRIDGILYDQESPPRRLQAALSSRVKLMAEMNIAERRLPQDGRIRVTLHGRRVDIRVSTVPTVHGESIVMRLLDRSSVFRKFEELGFSAEIDKTFRRLIEQPHGIILVTGPTGSGKTTTLYAALDKINAADTKIITTEDPVEYQIKGINQIPVKASIGLTFASSLRSILRQDPDVVMVGEIRDLETAEIAVQAALTGHLVFSTLHTNDACGAVARLIDMGAEPYLLSSVLEGVLAQRLLRRICQQCRTRHRPDPAELLGLGVSAEEAQGVELYRGAGCEACRGTGYKGRTGIYELLAVTEEVRSLVLKRASSGEIRRLAQQTAGLVTLREDGWEKAKAGVTTLEEVLSATQDDD
jgi:type II secretion system protein E